jgi:7-carboxy-7-deazaguanine synthase
MGKLYEIAEIFGPTIQGEGSQIGQVVNFIRFAGCNLSCSFCDTDHSMTRKLTAKQIVDALPVEAFHVVLTGGEPLLQVDDCLIEMLADGRHIHIETNGTIDIRDSRIKHITCSPKSPDLKLGFCDDLKVLYPFLFPLSDLKIDFMNLYFQPIENKCSWDEVIEACLKHDAKLSPQLHKLIGIK